MSCVPETAHMQHLSVQGGAPRLRGLLQEATTDIKAARVSNMQGQDASSQDQMQGGRAGKFTLHS